MIRGFKHHVLDKLGGDLMGFDMLLLCLYKDFNLKIHTVGKSL